jgi:hypothetical protein
MRKASALSFIGRISLPLFSLKSSLGSLPTSGMESLFGAMGGAQGPVMIMSMASSWTWAVEAHR